MMDSCWANRPKLRQYDDKYIFMDEIEKWAKGFGVLLDEAKQALDEAIKDSEHVHNYVRIDEELWKRLVVAVQNLE